MSPAAALDQSEAFFDGAVSRSIAYINRSLANQMANLQAGEPIEVPEDAVISHAVKVGDARELSFNRAEYRQSLVDAFGAVGWAVTLANKGPGMAFRFAQR